MTLTKKLGSFILLCSAVVASADSEKCFDFSQKLSEPIAAPPALMEGNEDTYQHGKTKEGIVWGQARGLVPRTVRELLDWLLVHENWKDMSKTKLKTTMLSTENYFSLHQVDVDLRVIAFVSINWVEQWAYSILKGTPEMPDKALVLYQKVDGTSHLPMLCGSVSFEKRPDGLTDLTFYERARSSHYESQMIETMHRNQFEMLRAPQRALSSR